MLVLIGDEQALFVEALCRLLITFDHYSSVQIATNPSSLMNLIGEAKPYDLIFLDMDLLTTNNINIEAVIDKYKLLFPLIIVSSSKDVAQCHAILQRGAKAYIYKSANTEIWLEAITRVLQGNTYYSAEYEIKPRTIYSEQELLLAKLGISPRQFHTLQLIGQGLSNKEIAQQLGIAESTVKTYVANLFQVLAVHNRTQCLIQARLLKLVC